MSAILKFDFQKREQLRFSEVNYLNYTKTTQFCMWQLHFPLKQGETRTSHGPIPHPLMEVKCLPFTSLCMTLMCVNESLSLHTLLFMYTYSVKVTGWDVVVMETCCIIFLLLSWSKFSIIIYFTRSYDIDGCEQDILFTILLSDMTFCSTLSETSFYSNIPVNEVHFKDKSTSDHIPLQFL